MTYLITILRRDGSRYKYQAAEVPAELRLGGEVMAYKVVKILEEQDNNMKGKSQNENRRNEPS